MNTKSVAMFSRFAIAAVLAAVPAAYAQTRTDQFKSQTDKVMAAGHESFVKKDLNKSSEQFRHAAEYVRRDSDKVAEHTKEEVRIAGHELEKLAEGIKKGTVKSSEEINKCCAQTDHALAKAWHATAEEAHKYGKDSNADLRKAGEALDGAAKWSGHQLSERTKASVHALAKSGETAGKGVKASAHDVDKWFKDIGQGIKDLEHKF
jgi:hypothetical protein